MTRILMAGWETGSIQQIGSTSQTQSAPSVATATPSPRSGTYSLKCSTVSGSASNSYSWLNITHATETELYYAFGMYRDPADATLGAPHLNCFRALDSAGNVNFVLTCEIDGNMRAYYASAGGGSPTTANLTLIAASSAAVSSLAWHLIEIHVIAATGATGTLQVKLDGTQVINATSQRTCQSNANLASLQVGLYRYNSGGNAAYFAFDDLRVNNTSGSVNNSWPGDGSLRALRPTGVGTTLGGTPLTGTASPNWGNVDEAPPNTADYNYGSAVGTGETYALADPPSLASCAAVNVIVQALNSDAGGGSIGITVKTAAGTSEAAAQAISASATFYNRLLETDPSDSAAWSSAKLSALEAGITVR